jgi:hypothetical protein
MSRVEEGRRLEPLEEVILEVDAEKVGAAHCNNAAVPRWTIVFFLTIVAAELPAYATVPGVCKHVFCVADTFPIMTCVG